jgi:hypothetical protein
LHCSAAVAAYFFAIRPSKPQGDWLRILSVLPEKSGEEEAMRRLIRLAIAAVVTGFLVWLPTAAQAGIVATGVD